MDKRSVCGVHGEKWRLAAIALEKQWVCDACLASGEGVSIDSELE